MKSSRQKAITEILEKDRVINTVDLAARFQVSLETIRRDLNQLEMLGVLKKVYGGAEYLDNTTSPWPSLSVRQESNRAAKNAIAAQAIQYVPDDCTIALDAGTTLAEFCRYLPMRNNLTVICSDIHSANLLLSSDSSRVYMMGGFLTNDGTSNGIFAKEFFSSISEISVFVCSCDGVDIENGLTSNGLGINELKRHYIKKAKTIILLADHSKFTQKGFYKVCSLSDIDIVITDSLTPAETISQLEDLGIKVVVASC